MKERKDNHGRDGTSSLNESQPDDLDESIVATQLDGVVVAEGEERGSPSRTSGVPQGPGVFPMQSKRASELAKAMQGGIHQGFKPSFSFTGKLAVAYSN